jgi:carboxyl-terminal processing protease
MLVFFEAMTKIKAHSLDRPGAGSIATNAIKAYMARHDPYGSYLLAHEYQAWKTARQFRFHGVGMDIVDRDGQFFCLPRPDSPALRAGIREGDALVAVDRVRTKDRSIYWVGTRIRGEDRTRVCLTVKRGQMIRQFDVQRTALKDLSVRLEKSGPLQILKISRFSSRTFEEVKTALNRIDPADPLVLDLRGNPGGDLFAAVDTAGLFLPENSPVLTVEARSGQTTYRARNRMWKGGQVGVWQNQFTASASEVLIQSLAGHRACVSFGTPSFGKAMTQKIIELTDGSALVISRGRLTGPKGRSWQDRGLQPMIKVQARTENWESITLRHLRP